MKKGRLKQPQNCFQTTFNQALNVKKKIKSTKEKTKLPRRSNK